MSEKTQKNTTITTMLEQLRFRIFIRFFLLLLVTLVSITVVTAIGFKISSTRTISSTGLPYISQLLRVHDFIEVTRYLDSLAEQNLITGYCVLDTDQAAPVIFSAYDICSTDAINRIFLDYERMALSSLHSNQATHRFRITFKTEINLSLALAGILLVIAIVGVVFIVLKREVSGLEKHLISPIVRLSTFINGLDSTASRPVLLPQGSLDLEIEEIQSIFTLFCGYLSKIQEHNKSRGEMEKLVAIARTTQMLAHDVRKPFSSLEMGLNLVKQAKSTDEMREMAGMTIDAVQKAMITVNGLIDDVMEIGRENAPKTMSVAIELLLETTFLELFQVHEKTKIRLDLRLQHAKTVALAIEELKVLRVFSNILGNAVQAMKREGTLLVSTREITVDGHNFIEITLGNSGPVVPEDAVPQLFEAFYTSNKEGGTGLGLAIAKKVVTAHGGRIWCESPGKTMPVEFHFTLPATTEEPAQARPTLPLPTTSQEAYERLKPKTATLAASTGGALIEDPREAEFERSIIALTAMRRRPLRVAVLDDEPIYRNAVTRLLGDNKALQRSVVLTTFSSGTEALEDASLQTNEVVICDIDLGSESCSGLEVIRTMRRRRFDGTLCVHSNRSLPEDFKAAMDAGADTVFPKPMGRAHLLQILASTLRNLSEKNSTQAARKAHDFPYHFAVIEDDGIVRSAWQAKFGERVQLYASATDLLGDGVVMEQVRDALIPYDFIVTDFYLDEDSSIPTGGMVATIVQRFHPIPVFLCSSVDLNEASFSKLFAGRLNKFDDFAASLTELIQAIGLKPRTSEGFDEDDTNISGPMPVAQTDIGVVAKQPPSGLSTGAILALRHDIRNHLANLQIIARRLSEHSSAQISEDADQADLALSAIEPHCDFALITQIREALSLLVHIPEDAPSRPQVLRQILNLAQELTLAHHMDEAWINPETHPMHTRQKP